MTFSALTQIQRRVLAIILAAGEARVENGAIFIPGTGELPAPIVRQLIGKGWLSREARGKDRVIIRPAIGAAGQIASENVDKSRAVVPA